ncbi:MAG TPA: copper homeostasis protein CutC [Bacteroidia bacterium]|nr:copper homeostasis protein CutC [Bacteroidia bacterium]
MLNTSSKYILEIACFNLESCLLAQQSGADRIEFCADYSVGGVTPNYHDILKAREMLHIPLHVIIRPRGGDFNYSKSEIDVMKKDIEFCKANNINGVVFGVLTNDKKINRTINKELVDLAENTSTTFHRAIDECTDIKEAMNEIVSLRFKRVLTSGGKSNAFEGMEVLKDFQNTFGEKIIIIPGGGIRHGNLQKLLKETNCKEYHSAAILNNSELINTEEVNQLKSLLV